MARRREREPQVNGRPGRVVEIRGRRVLVRDSEGERVCFLSGQRAVIGDRVRWVEAQGEGGKLVGVDKRETALWRVDFKGREQVLAANLSGVMVVASSVQPPFRAGLLDRYVVAAAAGGLDVAVVLNKVDLGVPDSVEADLALRESDAMPVFRVSAATGEGLEAVRAFLDSEGESWAVVGHSGVGKTSIIGALLPEVDVGAVGEISQYWGTGQHTTTGSRVFAIGAGEVVDSPGIRTFAPGGLDPHDVRLYFPGMGEVRCKYRNCMHREGEDGCVAAEQVPDELLASYRRMLSEMLQIEEAKRP